MDGSFEHVPVLFDECMDGLNIKKDGIYVDCTAGGGGHSFGIVSRLGSKGKVISLDKDDEALATCEARKKDLKDGGEWILVKSDFKDLSDVLSDLNIEKADGILADLGVSSHQIDTPERGFSYGKDGPLDMRMDRSRSLSAAVVVNSYSKEALEKASKVTRFTFGAPLIILVCTDTKVGWTTDDGQYLGTVDASIVMTQMMLEATNLGLGSCWVRGFRRENVSSVFELPDNIQPEGMLVLGYPSDDAKPGPFHSQGITMEEMVTYL